MRFQFLGNVLDYHISLSNPYPEDRNFNFELSDKKRDLNPFVFVVVPDLHAASRNRHF